MDAKEVLNNFVSQEDPLVVALRAALLELTTGQIVSRAYRAQEVIEEALAKHAEEVDDA